LLLLTQQHQNTVTNAYKCYITHIKTDMVWCYYSCLYCEKYFFK